ncbi:MAG: hypothetical protein ACI9HK_004748 [Pirellulaceae bacterium]|jgi:hypothetical protein
MRELRHVVFVPAIVSDGSKEHTMRVHKVITSLAVVLLALPMIASAAEWGLKPGSPDIKTAGQLAFGPDGILFVGDAMSATVFAIDTQDKSSGKVSDVNVKGIDKKVSELLGSTATIRDMVVNPATGNIFLSASLASKAAIVRVDGATGKLSLVSLTDVPFSKAILPDAPEDKVTGEGRRKSNKRGESITDLAYHEGRVLVSGLSKSAAPSTVSSIDFPFADTNYGVSLEIYHGAHGRYENTSAVRAFVPFLIDGEPNVLAGFTCTPLVKFPVSSIGSKEKQVRGTTVAELGNRNRPLDMIVYEKDGKHFVLMANSARGVMKIGTDTLSQKEGITSKVSGGGSAGQKYQTIEDLKGVVQLDRLNATSAVIITQTDAGTDLQTVPLP